MIRLKFILQTVQETFPYNSTENVFCKSLILNGQTTYYRYYNVLRDDKSFLECAINVIFVDLGRTLIKHYDNLSDKEKDLFKFYERYKMYD